MFICMQKMNSISNFFFWDIVRILQTFYFENFQNHNFAKYGIGGEISITILVFILDCFHEKQITKFFKKSKKPYFGAFWALCAQIWAKMNFSGKKVLPVFKYSSYLPSCWKPEKTNEPFLRKIPHGQRDRQANG